MHSLMHLKYYFDEIGDLLNKSKINFNVIGISESQMKRANRHYYIKTLNYFSLISDFKLIRLSILQHSQKRMGLCSISPLNYTLKFEMI